MNIHHKFIALFNATPGAFANTPSLNDTNLLLGYVQSVTGTDVTDDSDFIDHVLSNIGFVQDEDADLWDTAHGAMTGLVSANGRASAVDTAIQFLETVGQDPSSDYYRPAYRLIQKAEGSVVATEANNAETDPEVLKAIFGETDYGWLNDLGVLSENNTVLTVDHRLTIGDAENSAITPFGDSYDTVDVEGSLLLGSVDTINAARLRYENSHLIQNKTINLDGGGSTQIAPVDTFAVMAKFENSTLNFIDGGADFAVGNGNNDDDPSDTDPLAILKLVNSTLTGRSDDNRLFVGLREGANALTEISNSQINGFESIRVAFGNDEAAQVSNAPVGTFTATNSTLDLTGGIRSGVFGGIGNVELDGVTATMDYLEAGVTYDQVIAESDGTIAITNNSSIALTGSRNVDVGNGKGATGDLSVVDSSLTTSSNEINVGSNWWEDWESITGNQETAGTMALVRSTLTSNSSDTYSALNVGLGDYSTGSVTVSESTINGLRAYAVGGDSTSSQTTDLGGVGTMELLNSQISYTSSSNPSGAGGYHYIGGMGGVGTVLMNNSSHTIVMDSPITVGDSGGYYYTGFHVGRNDSSLTTGDEYDGTLRAINGSTLTLRNEGTGNTDLFFTVGARDSARGYAEFSNGSSLIIDSNNTNAAEGGIVVSSRSETYGQFVVDASTVTISGAAMLNSVQIGNRGAGDMEITNGGSMIVTTSGDRSNAGAVRVGDKGGAGTLLVDGAGSIVGGDAYTVMTIGERPEDQYQASPAYESEATAETYAGTTGVVTLSNGALMQFGTAGDGIPDIFVGNGGSLIASDDSTVVGDIQIIGTGTVSDNLLSLVI